MTQVALRSESEFAAGVACRPCRTVGHHFCQAHDYDEADQPACKTCLTGELCGPMRARNPLPEFDGPDLPPAPPPAAKPDPLRGEKLAETMDQRAAKPGACEYCGKPRHRGTCAERRAARIPLRDAVPVADVPLPVPEEVQWPVELIPPAAWQSPAVQTLKALVREPDVKEVLVEARCVKHQPENLTQATAIRPTFEVVPRSQVQWRNVRTDRYAELADRLRALGPGDLLKVSMPSEAAADSYAKNFTRRLAKYNLRVKSQRHGCVIFLEVKPPAPPTSEVPAS